MLRLVLGLLGVALLAACGGSHGSGSVQPVLYEYMGARSETGMFQNKSTGEFCICVYTDATTDEMHCVPITKGRITVQQSEWTNYGTCRAVTP